MFKTYKNIKKDKSKQQKVKFLLNKTLSIRYFRRFVNNLRTGVGLKKVRRKSKVSKKT